MHLLKVVVVGSIVPMLVASEQSVNEYTALDSPKVSRAVLFSLARDLI
jgi:hypothetical protein